MKAVSNVQLSAAVNRRRWIGACLASFAAGTLVGCAGAGGAGPRGTKARGGRLLYTSAGRTWLIHADGSPARPLEFQAPDQETWQPTGFFSDGMILMLSMEHRQDGPGRPFDQYYTLTRTHIWRGNPDTGALAELAVRERLAVFETPALLLPGDGRLLIQVAKPGSGKIYNIRLDGSDPREFTREGDGFPYGLSASPDGRRIAFHTAGPAPHSYRIWIADPEGNDRSLVAADPDHLFFAPVWSPDGRWLLFQDCHFHTDSGHDWADVCLAPSSGGALRRLTDDQSAWFGATYGPADRHGGGSNVPQWLPDGSVVFSCRMPGSRVPWGYQDQRADTDHFNRDYQPDQARGGTFICRIDPAAGTRTPLTPPEAGRWDFRATPSPDGRQIAFCRCRTGTSPALWIMRADGTGAREISQGFESTGADHPRWFPLDHG
jgi:hypothetical protein